MNFNEFLNEGSTSEYGGPAGLTKDKTLKIAQKFADAAASVDPEKGKWGVNKRTLEEDGFDLDYNDEEFDGGSYNIYKNGNVVNMAIRENPVLGKIGDDIKTIAKGFKKMMANESVTNEATVKKGSIVIPYASSDGEFVVDKVFKNKDGEVSYTGEFKKTGKKMEYIFHKDDKIIKESSLDEANLVLGLSTNNYPSGTASRYRIESTVINLRKVADLSKDSWKKYSKAFTNWEIGFEKASDRKEALDSIQKSFNNGQNDIREFGLYESVVNETGFKKSDIKKTIDFINKEIGIDPGYALIGDEDDIEEFDRLWDREQYEDAFDFLTVATNMEISTLDDVKNAIKESVVTEGTISPKMANSFKIGDKIKTQKDTYTITGYGSKTGATRDFEAENGKGEQCNLRVSLRGTNGIQVAAGKSLNFPEQQEMLESVVNERNITIKRQYTSNRPAVTVGKAAKVRNKMLEAIKDGKLSQEDFNNILKEMTTDSKRWLRRNAQCFNVSEDGITLSKTGSRILKNVMVAEATINEGLNYKKLAKQFVDDEWLDVDDNIEDLDADEYFDDKLNAFNREELGNSKEFDNNKTNMSIEVKKLLKGRLKQIFEATTKAPKIWVPGGFDKAIAKYPNQKITRKIVLDAAEKWDVNPDDAIKYVEFGWTVDLDENKNNNNMKTKFIYESFAEFVENKLNESTLNEAFKSAKLSNLFSVGSAGTKDLAGAFYNFSKLAIDKIEDYDIIEMDPQTARKEKRANAIYFYIVTNQKVNPHAETINPTTWNNGLIQSNTLLAITNGQNEWYSTAYSSYSKTETLKVASSREAAAGFDKRDSKRYDGSGITSLTKVAELADTAYVIDLDVLKARYSTQSLQFQRAEDKRGAIAFKSDKDFKAENKSRYNQILAQKASEMPMDSIVLGAIDTLATQIKDALSKSEKGRYGELIIGLDTKGREIKMSDASNLMRNILDEYNRYVGYVVESEKEVATGYSGKFYEGRLKESSKTIVDYVKKVDAKNYAW